jgi:hypothetical protein
MVLGELLVRYRFTIQILGNRGLLLDRSRNLRGTLHRHIIGAIFGFSGPDNIIVSRMNTAHARYGASVAIYNPGSCTLSLNRRETAPASRRRNLIPGSGLGVVGEH